MKGFGSRQRFGGWVALTACLSAVGSLNAAMVQYQYVASSSLLKTVSTSLDATGYKTVYAGGIALKEVSDPVDDVDFAPNYMTVCADYGGELGSLYWYQLQAYSAQRGDAPQWGRDQSPEDASVAIQNAAHLFYNRAVVGSDKDTWVGLQLAVWEALYDSDSIDAGSATLGFSTGRFRVNFSTGTFKDEADQFLAMLQSPIQAQYIGYLLAPTPQPDPKPDPDKYRQELLYDVTPVPEAGTLIGAALLGVPLVLQGRRRWRGRG